jgi:hypothetical protein
MLRLCLVAGLLPACSAGEPAVAIDPKPQAAAAARPAAGTSAPSTTPLLRARLEFRVEAGAKPVGLLARDLDGDGRSEWIGVTREPGSVQITSGASPRRASTAPAVTMGFGDWPLPPAWIGDSARMVFATRAPDELVVLDAERLWKQQDAASVLHRSPLLPRARVLSSGRLGQQSVIGVIHVDDTLSLFDERLQPIAATPLADPHACALHFAADGSGFVVGFQGSRTLRWYARAASGAFVVQDPVTLSGLPRALHACDLDGDQDAELCCALGDASVAVFGLTSRLPLSEELRRTPQVIEVARVPMALTSATTARGTELLVLSLAGQEYARFLWKDGSFECVQRGYAGQHPSQVAWADFDGVDGPDLVSAHTGAERWSALFAGPDGLFLEARSVPTGRSPHSLASADLDGDGRRDLGVIHALEGSLGTFLNREGRLVPRQSRLRAAGADRLQWLDVDEDGRMDAVWISREGAQALLHVAYGDGSGQVFERGDRPPLALEGGAGDLCWLAEARTLFVTDPDQQRLLRVVPEAGVLRLAQSWKLEFAPRSVAAWSNNGQAWVALGQAQRAWSVHRLNSGPSTGPEGESGLEKVAEGSAPGAVRALCAADLDGDGSLDLACLCVEEGTDKPGFVQLVRGEPSGSFANFGAALPTGARPYAIAAADLQADGRPELVVSAQNSHQVNLWIARPGTPLAYFAAPDLGVGTGPLDLCFEDLDGDGVAELLVTCAFSDEVRIVHFR